MTIRAERCTSCEEIELANVQDVRPSQVMPIPAAALAGFPEGRSRFALSRRRLLQFGVAGFASVYAPRVLGWDSVWESAVAQAAGNPAPRALVMLYLAGGNDQLQALVPTGNTDYPIYVRNRPTLHRIQGRSSGGAVGCTPIPGAGDELAFANPLVSSRRGGDNGDPDHGLDILYGDGSGGAGSNLALLPTVDYTPANLSHFESADYWFAGDVEALTTGWLGRYLDRYGCSDNPLQGVSIGSTLSKALRTQSAPVCAIEAPTGLGFMAGNGPSGLRTPLKLDPAIAALGAVPASSTNQQLAYTRNAYRMATEVHAELGGLGAPSYGTGYPPGTLGPQLELAAWLLGANLGTRVITIHWGSFDTHAHQLGAQDAQLAEFSRALSAFMTDLDARGIADRVSVLCFSEFSRRVAENASLGTDHGAGGLMMLAGQSVKGGIASPFPGLSKLDSVGDLLIPTDFRSVYQATISEWLGGDPSAILPGGPFPAVARADGSSQLFN